MEAVGIDPNNMGEISEDQLHSLLQLANADVLDQEQTPAAIEYD